MRWRLARIGGWCLHPFLLFVAANKGGYGLIFSFLRAIYAKIISLFVKKGDVDYQNIPAHIGIIMDGNGRWARRHGLDRRAGHAAGAETLRVIAEFCEKIGVKALTVYAFSTENWNRPPAEVDALMELLYNYLADAEKTLAGKNSIIRIIGDRTRLSKKMQKRMAEVEEMTGKNTGMYLNLAVNYGGRDEIVRATKILATKALRGEVAVEEITAEKLSDCMYTYFLPDPDLIIRPSGEMRLSNFLLWQSAYSEFWYSGVCWPDFTDKHLLLAISDYQKRNRRYGGV